MSTDSPAVIEIEHLAKSYGSHQVLRDLNLQVAAGEVYGLLGQNGSGKSTLLHLMIGFLKPTAGHVRILGSRHAESVRARIGYIPERQRYHTHYSAREYLRFIGEFSGLSGAELHKRIDEEIEIVGLEDVAQQKMGTFSKGMLQRIGVAQALLCDPDLLLIDEPTSGLDPNGQREVLNLLAAVRDRGHTVFLCTHYLHEIEHLCDRVGVLAQGRIAAEARVSALRGPGGSVLIEVDTISAALREELEAIGPAVSCDSRMVRITQNTPELQALVLRHLLDAEASIIALDPLESPLQQLYNQAIQGDGLPLDAVHQQSGNSITDGTETADEQPTQLGAARPTSDGDSLLQELLRRRTKQEPEPEPEPESKASE